MSCFHQNSAGPVQIIASSAVPLALGAVPNVPANSVTTIVTYTPASAVFITRIVASGTAYGKIELFKGASLIETQRMGPDRNIVMDFVNPLALSVGIPLDVKVTHYVTGELNNFEATIYGV